MICNRSGKPQVDMFDPGEAEPSFYPKYADLRIRKRYRAPKESEGIRGQEEIRPVGNTEYIWTQDRAGRHKWLILPQVTETEVPDQEAGEQ